MSFTTHITKMDERPIPKLWLAKPDFTIIERINGISNLTAKMNYMNENEISFEVNSHLYDELTNEQYQNPAINKMRNKYLIKMTYNNQTEWFIIENFSKTSEEKDYVPIVAYYIGSELDKKWVGDIEEIGVTPAQLFNKFLPVVAPNWSVREIDEKIKDVKREYTTSDASVSTLIEQVCQSTDAVVVFHNRDRQFSLIHRDNAGKFKGLKIKETTYLKGFTDEQNSRDLTTRLVLFGKDGLTINSVNPAGTDYIEDFSYYMKPFRRDSDRRVIEHSNYMSDELCHALLDYEEYFTNKAKDYENLTKKYSDLLKEQLEEEFKLTRLMATKQRIEDRIELLKPQGNFIERKVIGDSRFNVKYNTRYFFVIKNNGSTARVTLNNEDMIIPSGEYAYFKLHTPPQVTNEDPQLTQTLKVLSANANLNVVLTTASEADFEEEDIEKLDEKFNIQKYRELVTYQTNIVASVERRLKEYDNQRESINNSLAVDTFFPPHLVKERENFVNWGIWREEDHTDAKALLEDGLRQLKEHNDVERTVNVSLIDFLQSLEDKENWDKLSAGDKIRFSNKVYDAQMEAFISELNIDFDNHDISITLSNIIDLRDKNRGIAQKLASFVSTAGQVNLQKNQLGDQLKKTNQVMALLEGEWDANKRRITAANETVQIDNRGIVITSPTHPNEMLIAVAGLIAISNDGGETFKQAINTRGVVAERLIGKVLIGTELVMENDSGTFRFDNDGVRINASSFHLIADDGEDYFDTLLRKMQQEIITAEERISETIKEERESVESEIEDVTSSLTRYAQDLISALADGMLNEQEIHMLKLQMHMLDADYSQVVRRVLPIIQNHTIDPEIQNQLFTVFSKLEEDYSLLSDFIKALDTPTKVPQETIENIMNMLYRFKPAIEELVSMVETALENSEQNRIANAEYNMKKFTEVLKDDLNNEISDLKDSLAGLNEGLEEALSDGIITMVEKSQLSDALMRLESEKKDIDNRFHNTYNHAHLVNTYEKTTLEEAKGEYNSKFSILVSKIMQILNLESVPHTVIEEYKEAYKNFTQTIVTYSDAYEKAWEYITKGYADDARSQANKYTDGLRMEVEADIQDIQGNVSTFREDVYGAFKDGIITEQERNRLGIHHDMLEKEKSDLIQRYDTIITSDYLRGFYDVERLVETRSLYGQVHADLLLAIELAMMDSKITPEESKEATRLFELYVQRLTDFSRELELAIAALGESKAVAHTNEQLKDYMSLTVFNDEIAQIQAVIDGHITTWYYDYVPTLNNIPAKEWTDTKTKDAHVGDLFYYGTEGTAYRFMKNGSTYEWVLIKDTEVTKALKDAQDAVDLADAKRRVFVTQPTPPYDIGDLWITSSGELMRAAVKKGEGAIYTHNDWIKATKYTDDTKANQVGNLLNSYKESNNLEIKDLKESLGAFKQTVEGAFKDGIVAEYEVKILQTQIQSLDREKADVDAGYNQLLNHPSLTGAPKTRLQNAYTNFSETHNSLKTTINNVIKDGVITKEEYESTMALLNSYPTVLNTYMTIMNETYLHLIKLVEATAGDAKEVAERLDSWKSTSFETDVEGIFSRTGSSTWTSKWKPEVEKAIKDSVDGIEIGGRNLLPNSKYFGRDIWLNYLGSQVEVTENDKSYNVKVSNGTSLIKGFYMISELKTHYAREWVTLSIKLKNNGSPLVLAHNWAAIGVQPPLETGYDDVYTFYGQISANAAGQIQFRTEKVSDNLDFDIEWIKVEKGNKATDWTPAPEDLTNAITKVEGELSNYKEVVEGSFKDGLIDAAEAKAIAQQKLSLESEKTALDAQYNTLSGNSTLKGTAALTNLNSAKTQYDSSYNALISSVNEAIKDMKVTVQESDLVKSNFEAYAARLGVLSQRLEEASDAISTSKVDSVEIGGANLLSNSTTWDAPWDTGSSYIKNQEDAFGGNQGLLIKGSASIFGYIYTYSNTEKWKLGNYIFSAWMKTTTPHSPNFGYRNGTGTSYGKIPLTTEWQKIEMPFTTTNKTTEGRIIYFYPNADIYISHPKLEYGNKATGWTPAPEDVTKYTDDSIEKFYENTIKTNYLTTQQTDTRFARKAYESNVDTLFKNIATYKNDYSVKTSAPQNLKEADESLFKHPFSYEVTARVAGVAADNLVVGVFLSTNKGTKWELEILEQKGQSSYHPELFIDTNGRPSIRLWSHDSAFRTVEVVYTKYAGDVTNFKRAQSLIEQTAGQILIEANEYSDRMSKNLINNPTVSGSMEEWSGNTTLATITDLSFTGSSTDPKTKGIAFKASGNNTLYTDFIDLDPSQMYEVSVWLKTDNTVGSTYFGLYIYDENGGNIALDRYGKSGGSPTRTNNAYFWSTSSGVTSWTKFTSYIIPVGDNNDYKGVLDGVNTDFYMQPTANARKFRLRFLNYYNSGSLSTMYIVNPMVKIVDPETVKKAASISVKSDEISLQIRNDLVNKNNILSDINLSKEGVKISGNKIDLVGDVNMVNGKTTISEAAIDRLVSRSITAQNIQVAFNKVSSSINITSSGIETYNNGYRTSLLNGTGHMFYYKNSYVGQIGTGQIEGIPAQRGLRFALSDYGEYMAFSYRTGDLNPGDPNHVAMLWSKGLYNYRRGFTFNEDILINTSRVLETQYIRPSNFETTGQRLFIARAKLNSVTGITIRYNSASGSGLHIADNEAHLFVNDSKDPEFGAITIRRDATGHLVQSNTVFNRTYSSSSNMYVTSYGTIGRSTSALKYKEFVEPQFKTESEQLEHSKKILSIKPKTWYDKQELDITIKEIEANDNDKIEIADDFKLQRHFGAIADEFHDIGMRELVQYSKDGEVEGLAYDRISVHLIPLIKDLYDEIDSLKKTIKELT